MPSAVSGCVRDQSQRIPMKTLTGQYLAHFAGQDCPLKPAKLTQHADPNGVTV
jgi:hypothetical protein